MPMKSHPLDNLTSEEISLVSSIIKEKLSPDHITLFNSITLQEPPKVVLLPFLNGEKERDIPRKALAILIEKGSGTVREVVVNLKSKIIEKWESVPEGYQPTLSPEDCFDAERIAKSDPEVIERAKALGYENSELVVADPWSVGYSGDEPEFENKRLVQLFMYAREFEGDNHYAHPLDFVTVVDLNAEKVIRIEALPSHSDFVARKDKPVKIPRKPLNYDPELLDKDFLRKDIKPLQILSPEGPSFTVEGNLISWQKFQFRYSFNYREGLVLHDVRYNDGGRIRPLFYRMSISEMVVPYGDPRPPFHRKSAFDVGDYGLGYCANSLLLGCDCLGAIKYFDATFSDHAGQPTVIKNAVCLHEEDAGLLWKHTEYRTGKVNVTRSRSLVISFVVTVVNYEYAIYWTFYQDGTINFQIKATGELSTNLLAEGEDPAGHGTIVAEGINGQFHQHLFSVRLDTMIDGLKNTVSTVDVEPLEEEFGSKENPYGQGFRLREEVLGNSADSRTSVSPATSRIWKISNDSEIHPITKKPTAWKLIPMNSAPLMAKKGSKIRARAGFAEHSVWVTKQKDEEMFAAGFYVNQSRGGDGLPSWISSKDSIVNEDIVLWHTFGVTHIPRVEDFPVMPVETCGFTLKPNCFFTANPALDVPPSSKELNMSQLVNCH